MKRNPWKLLYWPIDCSYRLLEIKQKLCIIHTQTHAHAYAHCDFIPSVEPIIFVWHGRVCTCSFSSFKCPFLSFSFCFIVYAIALGWIEHGLQISWNKLNINSIRQVLAREHVCVCMCMRLLACLIQFTFKRVKYLNYGQI